MVGFLAWWVILLTIATTPPPPFHVVNFFEVQLTGVDFAFPFGERFGVRKGFATLDTNKRTFKCFLIILHLFKNIV
jgi:hypothetical protein